MKASQSAKWERTRAIGFWRYSVLVALVFSGAISIAISIFDYLTNPSGVTLRYVMRALIWLVSGFVTGVILWFYAEYKYKNNSGSAS